ncbi:MAG TPA: serine hydrolase domain-containing protein [Gemmatimonadaceae bacterium]|nr:serine hydrolase domain-containing protein [Gemmatimonadaceae bacterium]
MQVVCAALIAGASSLAAQNDSRPREAARRPALSRELRDSLRHILTAAVADHAFPGAYAVVGDSRGILAEAGAGHLDWAPSPVPSRHTLWDIASLTKVVGTTTALARLVERSKVALDSPVQRYVPDWTGPGKEKVTVRHLLTHTSGLPAFKPYDQQTHDPDSLAKLIFATPLERAPGDSMVYSDIGAFMMGQIVERVSGKRLDEYLRVNVFKPLAMRETMYNPPRSLWSRVAPTEVDTLRGGLVRGKVHDERAYYLGGMAAHAGLFTSAADLSRFAEMLLHGGILDGHRVLRASTIREFTAYADSSRSNRALGWQKPPAAWAGKFMSSRAYGHTGFTGTSIAIDPDLDLYIILLSNRVNPTRNNPKIGDVRAHLADAVVTTVRARRGPTINVEHR